MSDQQQARFDGWAIVDVMGHQRYVGYVTTEAYGAAVLFRIDVPALDARTRVTKAPGYINGRGYCPAGTTVEEGAVGGYTKLVGSGSIYAITPVTKEAALKAVEQEQPRPLMSVALPPERALEHADVVDGAEVAARPEDDDDDDEPDDDEQDEEADDVDD